MADDPQQHWPKGRDIPRGLTDSPGAQWSVHVLTILSSVALAILLVVTFGSVVMRYAFEAPVLGSNEIIQLVSVALVMLAMPAASLRGDHVAVDVLDNAIGRWGRFFGDILSRLIGMYLLSNLAWRAWLKLLDAKEFADLTNMLRIPLWPFYGLLALGSLLFALVLLLQLIDVLRIGPDRK